MKSSSFLVLAFLVVKMGLCSSARAGVEGLVTGQVVDEGGVSVWGASVQLIQSSDSTESGEFGGASEKVISETQSSMTGDYQFFSIPFGDYFVEVKVKGMKTYRYPVHVVSGGQSQMRVVLQSSREFVGGVSGEKPKEMVIKVTAKKQMIQNSASVSRSELNQKQISLLPQGGETSLPKLLANTTPGIVLGGFGQMFIRGNHGNIQYQIDGIQMPDSPSGSFGQSFSPRNIEQMEIITGGVPAEYGQRLSGVVNITTKSGSEKPSGEVELNYGNYNSAYSTYSPHLLYGGTNESGNLRYFFSLNYNRSDRGLNTPQPMVNSDGSIDQSQGGKDVVHDTSEGDAEFAKVDWQVDNQNKLSFIAFNSYSFFQIPNYPSTFTSSSSYFRNPTTSDSAFTYVPSSTNDTQAERNTYGQVVWKHTYSDKAFLQLAPYYKFSNIAVGNDPQNDLAAIPLIPKAAPVSIAENRNVNNLGFKGDYSCRWSESHLLKTGFQLQASRADGFVSFQTDPAQSQPTVVDWPVNGYFESLYLQDDYQIFKPLTLNAGLRWDATQFIFQDNNPEDTLLQPRLGLNYLVTEATKLHLFYGKLFEPAPVENLRLQFNSSTDKVTPFNIQAEKSDYFEAGLTQQILDQQILGLTAYYKSMDNAIDEHQLYRTSLTQAFNYNTGYAYGVEFSLRGKLSEDWSNYFNYSYSMGMGFESQGGVGLPSSTLVGTVLDHIQAHTSTLGATYSKNNVWWTGQLLYGSGLRTGDYNSVTLPAHFVFDTTVGYKFYGESWASRFKISLDVLNVFDNAYPITIANEFSGTQYAPGRQFFFRLAKEI